MSEHLGAVLRAIAAEHPDPRCGGKVLRGTGRTRDLVVGHVACEDVAERELDVAVHRAAARAPDELTPLERVQPLLGYAPREVADSTDRSEPEHLADDRRVLEQRLVLGWERVEAG